MGGSSLEYGPLARPPKYYGTLYKRDPKRDSNMENYPWYDV